MAALVFPRPAGARARMMATLDDAATLEELTALVRGQLDAACTLVTRIDDDGQSVLAHAGRRLPDLFMRKASLDYSICQHSVAMDFPLVIDDALSHPLLRGSLAVEELGIAAYIGAPVHDRDGTATGTICALEFHQRRWSEDEVSFIIEAARIADRLISAQE